MKPTTRELIARLREEANALSDIGYGDSANLLFLAADALTEPPERRVVERERKAWDTAVRWMRQDSKHELSAYEKAERDYLYPLDTRVCDQCGHRLTETPDNA